MSSFFKKNYSDFFHIAVSNLNDSFFANDVLQDVFYELLKNHQKYSKDSIKNIDGFLATIIKRRALDRNKSKAELIRKDGFTIEEKGFRELANAWVFQNVFDQEIINDEWLEKKREQIFNILGLKEKEGEVPAVLTRQINIQ